jgi:hypothetical protein
MYSMLKRSAVGLREGRVEDRKRERVKAECLFHRGGEHKRKTLQL